LVTGYELWVTPSLIADSYQFLRNSTKVTRNQ
jgi:hypothetical protein